MDSAASLAEKVLASTNFDKEKPGPGEREGACSSRVEKPGHSRAALCAEARRPVEAGLPRVCRQPPRTSGSATLRLPPPVKARRGPLAAPPRLDRVPEAPPPRAIGPAGAAAASQWPERLSGSRGPAPAPRGASQLDTARGLRRQWRRGACAAEVERPPRGERGRPGGPATRELGAEQRPGVPGPAFQESRWKETGLRGEKPAWRPGLLALPGERARGVTSQLPGAHWRGCVAHVGAAHRRCGLRAGSRVLGFSVVRGSVCVSECV
ncbi:collagen alpha-1(I) chain-like [Erinaceus europaeus]|uniref:Collagen alpha-1(I) chain-like n=1 Tax=Erinaceus europaeus TaxID=9365 RepID=A0ABM3YIQ6_ERIEU|nr:collagen alpha-1(I) chain-like [Erinaceus europaeus]